MHRKPFIDPQDTPQFPSFTREGEHRKPENILDWWYHFTAPPEVPKDAPLAKRELARRGRLCSTILLGMLLFLIASFPVSLISKDHSLLYVFLPSFIICIIVLYLNRLGKITIAGIVMVTGYELGYISGLLITPGGLGVNDLPRFDLLVEPVLLAVSFLPPRSVYLIALGNCIFIWAGLTFIPQKPELMALMADQAYTIMETPIALQIIVCFVTYLWVVSTNRAIERADRAELIAALERSIADQAYVIAEQKRQLEASIQQIINVHVRVANGDMQARVPLTEENVLWQIGGSLNNLLSRFQRLRQSEIELTQTRARVSNLVELLRTSKLRQIPIQYARTGTPLDPLVIEINGNYLISPEVWYNSLRGRSQQ